MMVSNEAEAFAQAARTLVALPREELREMGVRARQCAESHFDRRTVARIFLDVVGQVGILPH